MNTLYVVVVTTFTPLFMKMNEFRRAQCKKYNIPVLFVYNGKVPDGYELKEDERVLPHENHAPAMYLKFKCAIQEIYNMDNINPDYIVRVNSRTYVNFENLKYFLSYVGKEKVAAGPFGINDNKIHLLGTCMVFSRDVAVRFAHEDRMDPMVYWHSDDCTISFAVKPYTNFYDMNFFNEILIEKTIMPTELPKFNDKAIIFRIKNCPDRCKPLGTPLCYEEEIDLQYWKLILKKYDGIDYMNCQ